MLLLAYSEERERNEIFERTTLERLTETTITDARLTEAKMREFRPLLIDAAGEQHGPPAQQRAVGQLGDIARPIDRRFEIG